MKFFKICLYTVLIIVLFILITGWNISTIKDDDFWLHLKTAEYIIKTHSIPAKDIFLNSPQHNPWTIHSWLATIIFFKTNHFFGINGVIFLKTAIIMTAFIFIFGSIFRLSGNIFWSAFLSFFVFICVSDRLISCRTLIFSFMLFPILFFILIGYSNTFNRKLLYIIPFIFLIWVNLHGEFLTGIILLLTYTTGYFIDNLKTRKLDLNLVSVFLISFVVTFVNPYFYSIYTHIFSFAHSNLYIGRNSEWAPIIISKSRFYIVLTGTVFFISIMNIRKINFSVFLPFIVFTFMAITKIRFEYYSAVCVAFTMVSLLPNLRETIKFRFPESLKFIPALLLLSFLIFFTYGAYSRNLLFKLGIEKKMYPEGVISFMKRFKPEGKIVNFREWGGYLSYNLYPDYKVFIDGRVPEAAGETTMAYENIAEAKPGFEKYLDKYNIDIIIANYVVFRRAPDDPIQPIAYNPGWSLVFWDDNSLVYLRNNEKNKSIIDNNKFKYIIPSSTLSPFQTNDIDLAINECKKAISLYPSERGYIFLGFLYRKKELIDESIANFRSAISLNPESHMGYFNLGVIYLQLNNTQEALKYLYKSLEINPHYRKAAELIENIHSRTSKSD